MTTKEKENCQIESQFDNILNYDPSNAIQSLKIIKCTERWIEEHCQMGTHAIKYTQLRSIYQLLKENGNQLILALPRLVYKEASQEFAEQKQFVGIIRKLMEKAIAENKQEAFIDYMTTIVAYHKFYSSNKN